MGTAAADVLDLLHGTLSLPAASIVLPHLNRLPGPGVDRAPAARGVLGQADGRVDGHPASLPPEAYLVW